MTARPNPEEAIQLKHQKHNQDNIWQRTALGLAAVAFLGLSAPGAWALSLGTVVVQSALGEPLRAEIDIPEINAEEAATLKAGIASPEAFRAAGLDYNAVMGNLRVVIQRRADGRAFLRLTSDRAINDPFVDMILEASWASGRIVRDYTMLFDPPNLRAPVAPSAILAQTPSAETTPLGASAGVANSSLMPAPAAANAAPAARAASRPARPQAEPKAKADRAAAAKAAPGGESGKQLTVKPGDTASKIANALKPGNVSLDQMLVALLRSNPDAFINSNLNRIKSGVVINVPSPEQAMALGKKEAAQTVIAQSRDFNDFRKNLAANVPTSQTAPADRQASGRIDAKVDDKKAGSAAPDKLTLSKGAVAAQAEADRIAKDLAAKDAAARKAEVAKNISDLAKLGAASAPAAAAPAAPAVPSSPAIPAVPAAPVAAGKASAAVASVAAPVAVPPIAVAPAAPASQPAAAAPTPAVMAPAKPAAPAPVVAVKEAGLIDQMTDNPLIPAAGAGLLALLAGWVFMRSRQRKNGSPDDSAFLESRLQPESYFGSSGGQRVDTADSSAAGTSQVYSPSQLDAADDVDPVAEADVYLAYGRDIQAEEILKEALKLNPGRVAIHHKLLEIFAKRRDTKGFESAATEAYKATGNEGSDWTRICDLGLGIDPSNPLYQPGGKPPGVSYVAPVAAASAAVVSSFAATTTSPIDAVHSVPSGVDLDLDLDFSLDDENAGVISDFKNSEATSKMEALSFAPPALDIDFGTKTQPVVASNTPLMDTGNGPLEFTLPTLDMPPSSAPHMATQAIATPDEAEQFSHEAAVSFGSTTPGMLAVTPTTAAPVPLELGMLEFDLGNLSLDLNDAPLAPKSAAPALSPTAASPTNVMGLEPLMDAPQDPLATKLALAEEFSIIGDEDGARDLIQEVIAEATGDMKARAQAALAKLN